jgi:hypothetical protein
VPYDYFEIRGEIMFPWQELMRLSIGGVVAAYFEPIFWMIIALVGYQYWQLQKSQMRMFGVCGFSLSQQIILAILLGSIGGMLGSFLLTLVGINVDQLGLSYIWPVAIVLMAVNMRFLCFAYAGGLVALSKVLFGWPAVNVSQVLVLVAILHITESILIAISGYYGSMPVILRRKNGQLVGAFNLQNFWPLPLLLMSAVAIPQLNVPESVLAMPDWWPLLPITKSLPEGHIWMYAMVSVVAALGYSDIAVASSPQMRRRKSSLHLGAYSIILLALALLSVHYSWLQAVAAVVSFAGHEMLIQIDNHQELEGVPRYVPSPKGLKVLDTVIDTPAPKAGIKSGDILLNLHDMEINTREQLAEAITLAPAEFFLHILRNGTIIERKVTFSKGQRMLGVILVPEGNELYYVQLTEDRFWLWEKVKKVWGKNRK